MESPRIESYREFYREPWWRVMRERDRERERETERETEIERERERDREFPQPILSMSSTLALDK
jgi:hypothetical protein